MFSEGYSEKKLKVNLKLAINRLKLVEKKKTEIALRSRKEISDYLKMNKVERARIRVEHIIREDYLVEALEIVEMQLDLLLARLTLLQGKDKTVHVSIHEAVDSIIWAYPQIAGDCPELKIVFDQLCKKFGKKYINEVQNNFESPHLNKKLVSRLDPSAPKAYIVETYLEAIAQTYEVDYTADQAVVAAHKRQMAIKEEELIVMSGPSNPANQPQFQQQGIFPNTPQFQQQQQPTAPQHTTPPKNMPPNFGNSGQFDQMPNEHDFMAPSQPAPRPTNQHQQQPMQYNAMNNDAPLDATYQMPQASMKNRQGPSNPQTGPNSQSAKAKEAEQPFTGQSSSIGAGIEAPPGYNVIADADGQLDYFSQQVNPNVNINQQPPAEAEDFDFNLPEIPTNSFDDNGSGPKGPQGGDDDFDDLEARFKNLKK